jgi:pimeloyl-ACP methyl ester carboxylesterase
MKTLLNNESLKEADVYRRKLLADLPVKEQSLIADGIPTAYLAGGEGLPLVLLHGPGESSVWWMRVIPGLVKYYNVIVPDLPGHGSSGSSGNGSPVKKFSRGNILDWLDEFLSKTCNTPPVIIGHVVGGAIAARYAIQHGNKLKQLVLVDSLGLSAFRPAPRFAFEFLRFMINPDKKSYLRFLPQCMYNVDELSEGMGRYWQPFLDYNLACANNPEKKSAAKKIMSAMSGKIPGDLLDKINVPVTLVWGRHDKANRLKVAVKASKQYGWPLHIIEDTRDDPKFEKPGAFVDAVRSSVAEHPVEKQ